MRCVEPGHELELLARHVRTAAGAGRAERKLARALFCQRDQIAYRLRAKAGRNHKHVRHARHLTDRREVLERIVRQLRIQRRADRKCVRMHDQRVAIGARVHHDLAGDDPAGARAIVHHDLLARIFRHLSANQAREHVGLTAGGEGDEDADRFCGVGLGVRCADQGDCACSESKLQCFHSSSWEFNRFIPHVCRLA
jgi:hypothetical protein